MVNSKAIFSSAINKKLVINYGIWKKIDQY